MFISSNLKLYRKFLILTVLIGGLFILTSAGETRASVTNICCSTCDSNYISCIGNCYNGAPGNLNKCLEQCEEEFNDCYDGPPKCTSGC